MGATGRNRFADFAGFYHGRCLAALAIGHERRANRRLTLTTDGVIHPDWPGPDPNPGPLPRAPDQALTKSHVAAIIAEPEQAVADMRVPPPEFLHLLRLVAYRHGCR